MNEKLIDAVIQRASLLNALQLCHLAPLGEDPNKTRVLSIRTNLALCIAHLDAKIDELKDE